MNKFKGIDIKDIIEYIIVSICIFCSGAVAYQNNHKIILLISIVLMFLLIVLKKQRKTLNLNLNIIFFIVFYTITSIYHMINTNTNFFGEMGILAQFILCILICMLINATQFINKYNKIMYFLAITSIIMYMIPIFLPKFNSLFPIIQDYAGSKFNNAGIYCYPTYIVKHYYRNQSIFWECGAFQAFLNIALFLELYVKKDINRKHVFIYIITILTTKSTTGYIILMLLIFTKIIQMIKLDKKQHLKYILIFGICTIPLIPVIYSVIIQKFSVSGTNYFSFLRRYYDTVVDIKIIFGNIMNFLMGVGEEKYIHVFSNLLNDTGIGNFSVTSSSSNSITAFIAQHGILSMIPIGLIYIKGIFSVNKLTTKIIFFLMILIFLITENFIMAPVFLALMIKMNEYLKNDEEKING